jgi:hypothetical protein
MKKILLFFIFGAFVALPQSEKMVAAIEKNLQIMDTATTIETGIMLKNNFERIADAEPDQWIAQYYAGMANSSYAMQEKDISLRDEIIQKAEKYINRADELSPENSEIYVIKALIAYARLTTNPTERYAVDLPLAEQYLQQAMEFNPDNPRAYLEKAIALYYMPEMFGGGKKKALPFLHRQLKNLNLYSRKLYHRSGEKI